ncbi:MAG TPA: tetratricopeptide repeat protein, partial [Anaerolineae bacterium]|nr:tetratricopeptide repeat protein [Anaerolineae bacterium]
MYIGKRQRRNRKPVLLVLVVLAAVAAWYLTSKDIKLDDLSLPWRQHPTPTVPSVTSAQKTSAADALFAAGRLQEALAAYREAIELDPSNAAAHARLGRLLVLRGRTAQGLEMARRAVELDSESSENQAILGMALDWSGDYAV